MAEPRTLRGEPQGWTFIVTDLKQYAYCPRVVYYTYCLPLLRPTTFKMEAGIAVHEDEKRREQRRSLRPYGLPQGERHFDLDLLSEELGLRGRMDLAIRVEGETPEAIPVEYKNSVKVGTHVKRQLAAYSLLLQEAWDLPVQRGYVYSIPLRRAEEVRLTPALLGRVRTQLQQMRDMVRDEHMPPAPSRRSRCVSCEFRRFCNDL
jgi:CRISPR-associated exonuclease Cas4